MLKAENERLLRENRSLEENLTSQRLAATRADQTAKTNIALVAKREAQMKTVSQELLKANEIIGKFQDQVRDEHQKVKLGAQVINELEKVVGAKETELESARQELKAATEASADTAAKTEEANAEAERLRSEIGDLEKKVRSS